MCADGGNEDHRVVGVAERSTCRKVVRSRARRRRHANTVSLHSREMLVVSEQLDGRHCRVWAPVYDHLVQDVMCTIGVVGMVVVDFLPDQFFDQIAALAVPLLGSHDGSFEAETQADGDTVREGGR